MKKAFFVLIILAILTCCMSASFAGEHVNNTTDLNKAIEQAHAENKSIMLFFDQKDCHYCDEMKEKTLSNSDVISKLNEGYITVFIDINQQPKIASKYKVFGTPTVLFLDSNQKQIGKVEGYVDANEFLNNLKGI
jgi:thiol:disulfide interchange protein DsbD